MINIQELTIIDLINLIANLTQLNNDSTQMSINELIQEIHNENKIHFEQISKQIESLRDEIEIFQS